MIGVHFEKNSNMKAKEAVGIEIKVVKKNNMTFITSSNAQRFKIKEFESSSNFAMCEYYEDTRPDAKIELLASDIVELKQLWFTFNKKINQLLQVLPSEVVNRYDMVAKSLQPPTFEAKMMESPEFIEKFDETVFKMAQFYFAIFQAIFSKESESMRSPITEFLSLQDPLHRSRKLIEYFKELHGVMERKMFYI